MPMLIKMIKENAGIPEYNYEIVSEEDVNRIGAPKMVKKLTERTKYDLVMFLGDDCEPQPNFLLNAAMTMESFPDKWGLVGMYDVERPGYHAPVCQRELGAERYVVCTRPDRRSRGACRRDGRDGV